MSIDFLNYFSILSRIGYSIECTIKGHYNGGGDYMERLVDLRKKMGYTQASIAQFLDVARNTYSRYETGEREPDFETLKKLAEYFDVSTDYLLEIDNNKKSPDELTTEDKLRLYFYEKTGREPTDDELCRLDDYVDIFIKAHQK